MEAITVANDEPDIGHQLADENDEPDIGHQLADEITKAISVMTLEDFAEVDFFIEQSKPELSEANYSVLKAAFNQKYSDLESEINA